MQSILFKRKDEKYIKTAALIQTLDTEATRFCAASDERERDATLMRARGLLDRFVSARTAVKPHSAIWNLNEGKRDALVRKVAASRSYQATREQTQDFYQQIAPDLAQHLLKHTEQLDEAARRAQRAQAAEQTHAEVVQAAFEEAEGLVAAARGQADDIIAAADAARSASADAVVDQEAQLDLRKAVLERQMAQMQAQLDALAVRKQVFAHKDVHKLVLTACGGSFEVPLDAVEKSDFFYPCHMQAPDEKGEFRYEVPNVTAQELRSIAYFFNHDRLPGLSQDSEFSRALLREAVERHGPSSMLAYMDDPGAYVAEKYHTERIDRSVPSRAGIYLKVPEYVDGSQRGFMMRQSVVDPAEIRGVSGSSILDDHHVTFKKTMIFLIADYCNRLSRAEGLEPVYSAAWHYTRNVSPLNKLYYVGWNVQANGYRLPTANEWRFAMDCHNAPYGQSDSNNKPSNSKSHGHKKQNIQFSRGFMIDDSKIFDLFFEGDETKIEAERKRNYVVYIQMLPSLVIGLRADGCRGELLSHQTEENYSRDFSFRPVRNLQDFNVTA